MGPFQLERRMLVSGTTRRDFLKRAALVGTSVGLYAPVDGTLMRSFAAAQTADHAGSDLGRTVQVSWLGGQAPLVSSGVSWGVPWPRRTMPRNQPLTVTSGGATIPTQTWPLAYWPDGSVKWTGFAVAAPAQLSGPLEIRRARTGPPEAPVQIRETAETVEVATGPLLCRIGRAGAQLVQSLSIDGREIARDGRLIVIREDRSEYDASGTIREERYTSQVSKVTVEQAGPVRAVVRIEGTHEGSLPGNGNTRQWLPFSVRLYFTAGLNSIRVVHTFVFDGDQFTDFVRGIGIAFTVPFREELQNRHVRFAGDKDGLFSEPVLMSPGYKPAAVKNAIALNRTQMLGKRIPNLSEMSPHDQKSFGAIAVWDTYKLSQLAPGLLLDRQTDKPKELVVAFH